MTPSEQDKKLYKAWTKNVFTKSLTLLTLIIGSHPDKCDSSLYISECIIVLYVVMGGGVWLYFILSNNVFKWVLSETLIHDDNDGVDDDDYDDEYCKELCGSTTICGL